MSQLNKEIKALLSNVESVDAQSAVGAFSFPKEFVGFQGHFDQNPILPGICKIQATQVLLESAHQKKYEVQEVLQAKYVAPVSVDEQITLTCHWAIDEKNLLRVKSTIKKGEAKVAMLQLIFKDVS